MRGEIEIACTALRYRRFAWGRGRHPEVGRKFRRVSGVLRVFAGVEFGTVELVRVAASGGRNSFAQPTARLSPHSVGFGLSPTPPSGKAAGRQGLRDPLGRRSNASFITPSLSVSACRVRPRRAPLAPLKRRSRRERRFLSESRYSLLTYSSSPPAESSNELRRVAVRRVGWRRTARLKEPQKLGPKPGQQQSPKHRPTHSRLLSPARRENRNRFSRPKNKRSPKLTLVLRPMSASLRLRCRSAAFSRACAIHLYSATAEIE